MLKNNIKHKGFVVYQDIQWVQSDKRLQKILPGTISKKVSFPFYIPPVN